MGLLLHFQSVYTTYQRQKPEEERREKGAPSLVYRCPKPVGEFKMQHIHHTTPVKCTVFFGELKTPYPVDLGVPPQSSCYLPRLNPPVTDYSSRHQTRLLDNPSDDTGGHGASTLADVDALSDLDGVGVVQVGDHLDVVAGHHHLGVLVLDVVGEEERARLVGGADVHLGAVVLVEAGVAAALLLGQDVEGDHELAVGLDGAGLDEHHAALDVLAADAAEEEARVVAGAGLVAGLVEGLDVGHLGLDDLGALAEELDFRVLLEDTALDTARGDGAAARDGEDVLDGHEEGFVEVALGGGDPLVDGREELVDLLLADLGTLAFEGAQGGAHDDGRLVACKAVRVEQLTHLHLDQLQHLGVLEGVDLVDEDDDALDADLAGEEQVLAGLGHLTVRGGNHDDGAVHVGGSGNHVLDVIGVTGTVDVGVVAVVCRVLDVRRGNGDTTFPLLGGLVDGAIVKEAC